MTHISVLVIYYITKFFLYKEGIIQHSQHSYCYIMVRQTEAVSSKQMVSFSM